MSIDMREINSRIGHNIKFHRLKKGMTLKELAELIDVSYQQVQKYESGKDNLNASRMYSLAHILDMDISEFFNGLKFRDTKKSKKFLPSEMDTKTAELVYLIQTITDKEVKKSLLALLKNITQQQKQRTLM